MNWIKCDYINSKITKLFINEEDQSLEIHFYNEIYHLIDDGHTCCENRYIKCDDDLSVYIGANFLGYEVLNVEELTDGANEFESHEINFVKINTSKGSIRLNYHNEHNGYYSGFGIIIEKKIR